MERQSPGAQNINQQSLTTEAEYISGARASQQASWLMSFLAEVDLKQEGPLTLHGDNFRAVSLTENTKKIVLIKHIEM